MKNEFYLKELVADSHGRIRCMATFLDKDEYRNVETVIPLFARFQSSQTVFPRERVDVDSESLQRFQRE